MVSLKEKKKKWSGEWNSVFFCLCSLSLDGFWSLFQRTWITSSPQKLKLLIQPIDSPLTAWLSPMGEWITSVPSRLPQVSHWHSTLALSSTEAASSQVLQPQWICFHHQNHKMKTNQIVIFSSLFCLLIPQSVSKTRFWQKLFAAFPSIPWVTGDWCQVRKWNVNFIKHPLSSLRINPDSRRT